MGTLSMHLTRPIVGSPQIGHRLATSAPQAKLEVGAPGDVYEREADAVADRVMRSPAAGASLARLDIQRKCAACEKDDESVQRQGAGPVSPDAEQAHRARGAGAPLPETMRNFFEPRLGADLGGVRVHTDASADRAARAMGALAYTHHNDIVFRNGSYAPDTAPGRRLVAHELTHVVQQGAAQRRTDQG